MGCIRVDKITEYLCEPLSRCLKDEVLIVLLLDYLIYDFSLYDIKLLDTYMHSSNKTPHQILLSSPSIGKMIMQRILNYDVTLIGSLRKEDSSCLCG
jgi:hypothetical protein